MDVIDVATARAVDRDAVERLGMPSVLLMENAAHGVVRVARELGSRFVVLCGPGNNGGDGLAVTRLLGRCARAYLLGEPDPARCPDAALQLRILRNAGVRVGVGLAAPAILAADQADAGIVWIDALFGTGLARGLEGDAVAFVRAFDAARGRKVSVDVPSGLDADTGQPLGEACHAEVTVTFHAIKRGLVQPCAAPFVGRVVVAPLGLP